VIFTIVNTVKMMDNEIEGKIVSSAVAAFGNTGITYGYIGVQTDSGERMKIKVDSYTEYETLEMGEHVRIETHSLGDTRVIVARRIERTTNLSDSGSTDASTAVTP
jgi:hypothetical protein